MNEAVPLQGGELGSCSRDLDLATNGLYADGRMGAQVGPWQRLKGYPPTSGAAISWNAGRRHLSQADHTAGCWRRHLEQASSIPTPQGSESSKRQVLRQQPS